MAAHLPADEIVKKIVTKTYEPPEVPGAEGRSDLDNVEFVCY